MKSTNLSLNRSVVIGVLALTTLMLNGCSTYEDLTTSSIDTPAPYSGSELHPITVAKGPVTLEVATTNGSLQPTQVNAISGFTHQAMSSGLTPMIISRPNGGGVSARVASEIAALVSQQGMPRSRIRMSTYAGPAAGPVTLSYITTAARTAACGQWTEDATETFENRNTPNHGCAVQANIAAMIADPQTLVVPRPKSPIIASTRMAGITALSPTTSSGSSGSTTP
jgi:pilus assembly protein CpaD